ncbi:protein twisted gastrulation-like isoform X2 [Artemia franciscana]|uniref:protein twisted gastrulation-like isoform X2 n=1 Tax=Artemia franciscana TaxID=6661 RepID=UPI0032D9D73A
MPLLRSIFKSTATFSERMKSTQPLAAVITCAGFICILSSITMACNEAVCASIVSKCMLTQACNCELRNCTCCKDCFSCLSYLYSECCSCVDLCPKPNVSSSELSRISQVEVLPDSVPELFLVLTEEADSLDRWTSLTFPTDFDASVFKGKPDKEMKYKTINQEQEVIPKKETITVNCTVAYLSQCVSWQKCKASCRSMGASAYRWFHDACCECVGHNCPPFGVDDSRCSACPDTDDDEDDEGVFEEEEEFDLDKAEEAAMGLAEEANRETKEAKSKFNM